MLRALGVRAHPVSQLGVGGKLSRCLLHATVALSVPVSLLLRGVALLLVAAVATLLSAPHALVSAPATLLLHPWFGRAALAALHAGREAVFTALRVWAHPVTRFVVVRHATATLSSPSTTSASMLRLLCLASWLRSTALAARVARREAMLGA